VDVEPAQRRAACGAAARPTGLSRGLQGLGGLRRFD
jgi:hypothetical protein